MMTTPRTVLVGFLQQDIFSNSYERRMISWSRIPELRGSMCTIRSWQCDAGVEDEVEDNELDWYSPTFSGGLGKVLCPTINNDAGSTLVIYKN